MVENVNENEVNPLLVDSDAPFGAPRFDLFRTEHYLPAFKAAISEAKAEIDAIVSNPEPPSFENTVEAMEYAGSRLNGIAGIFYNLMEAATNDRMQEVAEEISPELTAYSMYVSLHPELFRRVREVYGKRESLGLDKEQMKLLEDSYKGFVRNGANLSESDKEKFSKMSEELSLLTLQFGKNVLAATNAYSLHITEESGLDGLPDYIRRMGAATAKERGLEGWVFTLDFPSYSPFMKNSARRDLRKEMYMAYNTRAVGGESDNTEVVKKIVGLRIGIASILGYRTYADYALEERMAGNRETVRDFLESLLEPSLPYAEKEVADVLEFARKNGFEDDCLMPWDFSFWAERYQEAEYALNAEELKPYFRLEDCIGAVFNLATRLYGVSFTELDNVPVYHPDVKVYEVKDADGSHLALFYADFFPRPSKRNGAWMTEFRGQGVRNGKEYRPFISIVTNFTKPTGDEPSLLTHDELTTLLHEFGHSLHGIFAKGRYESLTGTNVARDFVELPSQIMENWAFEPEYLDSFARDYRTGEVIPRELIDKIVAAKNYLSAYYQVRQLQFGLIDMAWHDRTTVPEEDTVTFEHQVLSRASVLPVIDSAAVSPSFGHIFSGGYSAGYYSYKWAEVLEADAFEMFKQKGIFNKEVARSFRENILSKGASEDAGRLYRNFRGRDPEPGALMRKLGLS